SASFAAPTRTRCRGAARPAPRMRSCRRLARALEARDPRLPGSRSLPLPPSPTAGFQPTPAASSGKQRSPAQPASADKGIVPDPEPVFLLRPAAGVLHADPRSATHARAGDRRRLFDEQPGAAEVLSIFSQRDSQSAPQLARAIGAQA